MVTPIKTIVVIGAGGMGAAYASKFYDLGKRVYSLRKTEVEMSAGKLVELGKEYGIPTPVNQILCRIIKAMQENCGFFKFTLRGLCEPWS